MQIYLINQGDLVEAWSDAARQASIAARRARGLNFGSSWPRRVVGSNWRDDVVSTYLAHPEGQLAAVKSGYKAQLRYSGARGRALDNPTPENLKTEHRMLKRAAAKIGRLTPRENVPYAQGSAWASSETRSPGTDRVLRALSQAGAASTFLRDERRQRKGK